jgi:putative flavoprotein involved in K+ transport
VRRDDGAATDPRERCRDTSRRTTTPSTSPSTPAAHDLDVKLGTRVDRILPAGEHWLVRAGGREFAARAVVVATGKHNRKWLPRWPGLEEFGGELLHSADYRSGRAFAGRRALVVGIGNSGAEIATDLVDEQPHPS